MRFISFLVVALVAAPVAWAQQPAAPAVVHVDESGTRHSVLAVRQTDDGLTGAAVALDRADGSGMLMEYGFSCEDGTYAYLGMIHEPVSPDTGLREDAVARLRGYSDSILGDRLNALALMPVDGEPEDAAVRVIYAASCGEAEGRP